MYHSILRPTSTQLHNLNLVLKKIKNHGPLSRADIARDLNCSKSTVTNIISLLIRYGLVSETGKGNPVTGRKSTLLEFNPATYFVIAVDTRPEHLRLSVTDLSGGEACSLYLKCRDTRPAVFVKTLIRGLERLIASSKIEKKFFIAAGVMVSGIVDPVQGVVLYSALLNWESPVPLAGKIQEALGIPVYVENDVNALALAEYWLCCGQSAASIAYLYLDKKIGGAYIHDGLISQGADFAFAEFGKLIVSGEKGPEQLEYHLSLSNLAVKAGIKNGFSDMKDFTNHTDAHPAEKEKIYSYITECLSQVIAIIVAVLNPGMVLLGGSIDLGPAYIEELIRKSRALLPPLPHRTLYIVSASLRGDKEILGAAAVAISNTRFKFIVQG